MPGPLPSVTIAVPAFNHARHVVQALDSMLDSGLPDVEIILCDDASTDNTPDLIEAWIREHRHAFRRLHLIRHRINAGLCASLNDIVAEATGELIHIIASDDYFLPGGLLTKTRAMVEHPEWQVAFCDGQAVGPENELYLRSLVAAAPFVPARLTPEGMGEELLYHWAPPVHQMTWRRSAYKVHGGDYQYDTTVFCEDYDSALWAAGRKIMGFIPEICQAYRYRSWPQTTNRNSIREYRDTAHVLAKNARAFPAHLRAGCELLSSIHFNIAIGDHEHLEELWRQHHAAIHAYHLRIGHTPAAPPDDPAPATPAPGENAATVTGGLPGILRERIHDLETLLSQTKASLKNTKESLKKRSAEAVHLKEELTALQHRLRYHAANPARALNLWWSRLRKKS
ncbi:MAG: glycosyl transferase [Verrucomicrobiales bacterium]|nr:glycosyl transferase [Verrucomicrobiales bacterium]